MCFSDLTQDKHSLSVCTLEVKPIPCFDIVPQEERGVDPGGGPAGGGARPLLPDGRAPQARAQPCSLVTWPGHRAAESHY